MYLVPIERENSFFFPYDYRGLSVLGGRWGWPICGGVVFTDDPPNDGLNKLYECIWEKIPPPHHVEDQGRSSNLPCAGAL